MLYSLQLLALALVVTAVTGHPKAIAKPSGYVSHGHTYGTRSADSESGMIKQEYNVLHGWSVVLSGQTYLRYLQPVDPVSWLHAHARGYKKDQLKGAAKQEGAFFIFDLIFWAAVFAAIEEDCQRCYRCYDYCG